jgi:hypothetical protein
MALEPSKWAALYVPEPAPYSGTPEQVVRWAADEFSKIARFLRRPEWPAAVFTQLETATDPDFRPQDGMMIYVGENVLSPQAGFYVREGNAWKKVT